MPEAWFDVDFPGHYFRRVQSVQVSVPSVTGPIAGLTAELELIDNHVRYLNSDSGYPAAGLRSVEGAPRVIATSTGADDGGVFSLDWRDSKYLPFERHGAISTWELRLTGSDAGTRPTFDWQSIADVVLTMRYTARPSGPGLKNAVIAATTGALDGLVSPSNPDDTATGLKRAFRARVDFPDAWQAFVDPPDEPVDTLLELPITRSHFPVPFQAEVKIKRVELFLRVGGVAPALDVTVQVGSTPGTPEAVGIDLDPAHAFGLPHGQTSSWAGGGRPAPAPVKITAALADVAALTDLDDLLVVLHYALA